MVVAMMVMMKETTSFLIVWGEVFLKLYLKVTYLIIIAREWNNWLLWYQVVLGGSGGG